VHKLPKKDSDKNSSNVRLNVILIAFYLIAIFIMGLCLLKCV
jgi:hypothetical protein